ncbi:MAG: hypothetical protein ACRCTZ_05545 [Sarcina sp.]
MREYIELRDKKNKIRELNKLIEYYHTLVGKYFIKKDTSYTNNIIISIINVTGVVNPTSNNPTLEVKKKTYHLIGLGDCYSSRITRYPESVSTDFLPYMLYDYPQFSEISKEECLNIINVLNNSYDEMVKIISQTMESDAIKNIKCRGLYL